MDRRVEAAAAVIFCHAQFAGDDFTARSLAKRALEAADRDAADMRAFGASDAACYKWPRWAGNAFMFVSGASLTFALLLFTGLPTR